MSIEFIQGKNFATQVLQDAMASPAAFFGEEGPIVSALRNLEKSATSKPAEYARGVLHIVAEARKLIGGANG
ncbi:hypothetical protein D3C76_924210 [compost metagenome]